MRLSGAWLVYDAPRVVHCVEAGQTLASPTALPVALHVHRAAPFICSGAGRVFCDATRSLIWFRRGPSHWFAFNFDANAAACIVQPLRCEEEGLSSHVEPREPPRCCVAIDTDDKCFGGRGGAAGPTEARVDLKRKDARQWGSSHATLRLYDALTHMLRRGRFDGHRPPGA